MTSFHALTALLQMIAAFLIFLASYLALFAFVIICLVAAAFIYKGADFLRARKVKSNSQQVGDSSKRKDTSGGSPEPRQRMHQAFSGVSVFRSPRHQ